MELAARMKLYEIIGAGQHLIPNLPVCIRLDGKAFHQWARGLRRPYDERLHTLFEFRELLASGAARYVRVDPCLAGGLTAAKKIAALAESFQAGVMPHGALSPVATAIAVQLDACIPNFVVQDYLGDDRPPKSEPDEHSLEARWVTLEELAQLPLRGQEVMAIFRWVANGATVYPLELLGSES